jgi:pyridoxal phosphate enzyme (YggS family)
MFDPGDLAGRIARVRDTIATAAERSRRRPEDVLLVAVSKTVTADAVVAAWRLGIDTFGENRVQEAAEKIEAISTIPEVQSGKAVRWHLIGHLQANKARQAVRLFTAIESIDSLELATRVDRISDELGVVREVLLEVNIGGEASKFGFAPADVPAAFRAMSGLAHLRVTGLMTVAPAVSAAEEARPYFRQLRELRDRLCEEKPGVPLPHLSMGMTGDYPVAIEEGATIVRVGRAIFGERPA